jgi:hypothetical protein
MWVLRVLLAALLLEREFILSAKYLRFCTSHRYINEDLSAKPNLSTYRQRRRHRHEYTVMASKGPPREHASMQKTASENNESLALRV